MKSKLINFFKGKNSKLHILLVGIAILFIICAVAIGSQISDLHELKSEQIKYTAELKAQEKQNDQLKKTIKSGDKEKYIEQKARERGYAKKGEVVFYDVSGGNSD